MKTMQGVVTDKHGNSILYEYLISVKAIKDYLHTDDDRVVNDFVEKEYIWDDTNNIVDLCMKKDYDYEIIREEFLD